MLARFMSNFRKPQGLLGRLIVGMMNKGHAPMIKAVVDRLEPGPADTVLDIGCGGGEAIRLLAERAGTVAGIDISEVSVRKSLAVNRRAAAAGRVTVTQADVLGMPFADATFTLATAFETVFFWENIEECFAKVYRVLKPGGRFAVAVEAWKDADGGNNFPKIFSSLELNLYSPDELHALLAAAGFLRSERITGDSEQWQKWLCIVGQK